MSPEIFRSRLIEGNALHGRRFVALFAAAGFGKSTLARQLATRYASTAVCDFRSCKTLADAISCIAALRGDSLVIPEQGGAHLTPASLVDYAVECWRKPLDAFVIFENSEALALVEGAREALIALLAATPYDRSVCICSRVEIDVPFWEFATPDEAIVVKEAKLAFSESDLRELFSDEQNLHRLYEITRGWPLCVRLVERLTQHRSLGEVLSDLGEIDLSMLYAYLVEHVIARLDPTAYQLILLISAAESLQPADLRRVFGTRAGQAERMCRASPFITARSGEYIVHPLIAQSILQRDGTRAREALLHAASAALPEDRLRAGVLYAKAHDYDAAAAAIQPLALAFAEEPRDPQFAWVLARIPHETLLRHARLYGTSMVFSSLSVPNEDRLRDALRIEANLSADADEETRASVAITAVNALANLGRLQEALEITGRLAASANPSLQIIYHMFRGGVLARMGKYERALQDWQVVQRLGAGAPTTLAVTGNEIPARHARSHGDYASDEMWLSYTLQKSVESANINCYVLTLAEGIFAAWFRGDRGEYAELVRRLNEASDPLTMPGTRLFRNCVNGNLEDLSPDSGRAQLQAFAYLIALSFVHGARARTGALHAIDAAERANEPFLKTLAHVALAYVNPRESVGALQTAAAHAAQVESPPLQHAVAQLQTGVTPAMFLPMRSMLLGDASPDRFRLAVLDGTLHRGGVRLAPTKRELELLAYVAFRGRVVSRDELAEAMFPNATSREADGALRVTVSRARKKFGDSIITSVSGGYAIGANVDVPMRMIQARVERCSGQRHPSAADLVDLQRDLALLRSADEDPQFSYEWSPALESAVQSLISAIEKLLSASGSAAQQP